MLPEPIGTEQDIKLTMMHQALRARAEKLQSLRSQREELVDKVGGEGSGRTRCTSRYGARRTAPAQRLRSVRTDGGSAKGPVAALECASERTSELQTHVANLGMRRAEPPQEQARVVDRNADDYSRDGAAGVACGSNKGSAREGGDEERSTTGRTEGREAVGEAQDRQYDTAR